MPKLLYQGHGSYRITIDAGAVIYVDPYVGEGYDIPADFVFITHQHSDHNQLHLITQKPGCRVITEQEALAGGIRQTFDFGDVKAETVEANNKNHDPASCVGYLLTIDGVRFYAAGDTSMTAQMHSLAARNIDYALLPCDGIYNMDPAEASRCAAVIGARYTIPIHTKPGQLFDRSQAEQVKTTGRLIVQPGEEIICGMVKNAFK